MTSVHGITVFGGTFPAEIWHSLYSDGGSPLRGIRASRRSRSAGRPSTAASRAAGADRRLGRRRGARREAANCRRAGRVGGYDPNAYAPGAGQEPYAAARRRRPPSSRRRRRGIGGGAPNGGGEGGSRDLGAGAAFALIWAGFVAYLGVLAGGAAARRAARLGGDRPRSSPPSPLAPVLLSHDVYSYVDYARLGVVHGLDPYVHPPARGARPTRPSPTSTWTEATSAYGPALHPRHLPARLAAGRRSPSRC